MKLGQEEDKRGGRVLSSKGEGGVRTGGASERGVVRVERGRRGKRPGEEDEG